MHAPHTPSQSSGKVPSRDTRFELLKLGSELLLSRGYNGFSYQDLSERLNIRKASIHHHFPSKEDLGLALLDMYVKGFHQLMSQAEQENWDEVRCIHEFCLIFAGLAKQGDKVCAGGVLSVEYDAVPPSLRSGLRGLQDMQRKWLRGKLEQGRRAGTIRKQGAVDSQVDFILATLQGALQLARVQEGKTAFPKIVEQLQSALLQ